MFNPFDIVGYFSFPFHIEGVQKGLKKTFVLCETLQKDRDKLCILCKLCDTISYTENLRGFTELHRVFGQNLLKCLVLT